MTATKGKGSGTRSPDGPGRVLIIAGSDPSGGAGIQADIKTVTRLGHYAAAAIVALTVQNTTGVSGVHLVPEDIVRGQISAVLDDIGADAVKIGMLANADIITAVADSMDAAGYTGPVVLDPVMVATSGDRLLADDAVDALKTRLLPRASLVTPNLPEATVLTGLGMDTEAAMEQAGQALITAGAGAALIKGGHGRETVLTDILVMPDSCMRLTGPRIETRHTHGTGCTLSSAVATGLAAGLPLPEACRLAHAFVRSAIENAPGFGAGHGPLGHERAEVA